MSQSSRPAWWLSVLFLTSVALSVPGPGWAAAMKPDKAHPAKSRTHTPPAQTGGASIDSSGKPVFDTAARYAVVIDYNSGATLLDKNADEHMPTASMSKIMTAYQVYTDIKAGKAKLDDMLPVSQDAWKTGGSKMFVPYPGQVKVSDLLRGLMIQSGNDACVVLAEGLAGSTDAFVAEMNATAKKLGLTNSHFVNVDGLPVDDHYMSPRDLVMLSERLIRDYPELYKLASEKEFTFNNIKQGNRNPLLYRNIGADGIKTGHTDEAGYGLVGSAIRDGRRVIIVIAGLPSMKARDSESERLMEWAFRSFDDVALAKKGVAIDQAPVWLGDKADVPVSTEEDAVMTVPRGPHGKVKVTAVYDGPIKAPVTVGEKVGELQVAVADGTTTEYPLVALAPVEKLGPVGRAAQGIAQYIWEKKH